MDLYTYEIFNKINNIVCACQNSLFKFKNKIFIGEISIISIIENKKLIKEINELNNEVKNCFVKFDNFINCGN